MHKAIENRAMSGFPLSIATGLAFETLTPAVSTVADETREVNRLEDLSTYSLYVFNVGTLVRNLINAVDKTEYLNIPRKEYYEAVLDEMSFISDTLGMMNAQCKFYINDYKYVKSVYGPKDCLRKMTTDKQVFHETLVSYCLTEIRKQTDVELFSKDIKYGKEHSVLLFTHTPFDLLSHSNYLKMDLLESHTGAIKSRKDWWTKYYPLPGDRDMSFLPFFEYFLEKFGDKTMFAPGKLDERISLYETMKAKKINPLTSEFSLLTILGK